MMDNFQQSRPDREASGPTDEFHLSCPSCRAPIDLTPSVPLVPAFARPDREAVARVFREDLLEQAQKFGVHALHNGTDTPGAWRDRVRMAAILSLLPAEPVKEMREASTPVPNWLISFLRGEDHWPGHPEVSFGDSHPSERGAFFWRRHLASVPLFAALSPSPRDKALEEALALLRRLGPHLDAIVCYASDMGEHEPNRLAHSVRAYLKEMEDE